MAGLPTFSAEAIVRDRLALLGASTNFLAALAGIPQSRLSLAFSGTKCFSREDAEMLKNLLSELAQCVEALKPIPLALTNPNDVRRFLDCMHQQGITAEDVHSAVSKLFHNDNCGCSDCLCERNATYLVEQMKREGTNQ